MISSLGMRLTSYFQPTRRVEDDVVYIARMVSDNTEDGDVRDAFFETAIQL
jgi:nuclear cap-binding protein subunit 1